MATLSVSTIDEVKQLVGHDLGAGRWMEVTQERVNAFADATDDHQWIHVDEQRARKSDFTGTIAHGYLTLSLSFALLRDRDGPELNLPTKMIINYGLNRVRFPMAVRVGARIRARAKLLSVDEISPNVYQLAQEITVEIEGLTKPAMVAESLMRFYL